MASAAHPVQGQGQLPPAVQSQSTEISRCGHIARTTLIVLVVLAALSLALGATTLTGKLDVLALGSSLSQTSAPFWLVVAGATALGVGFVTAVAYSAWLVHCQAKKPEPASI